MTLSNREILLQGSMFIEQEDDESPLRIELNDFVEAVDNSLIKDDPESVIEQLIENISNETGYCVLSHDIDASSLKF